MNHSGGHLPFEATISDQLNPTTSNRVTVAVNNTLNDHTIPQGIVFPKSTLNQCTTSLCIFIGQWLWYPGGNLYPPNHFEMSYTFDFFNYAGIHRPVTLYTVPKDVTIDDVTISTTIEPDLSRATVNFDVSLRANCLLKLPITITQNYLLRSWLLGLD